MPGYMTKYRIERFNAGMPLVEIARLDGVKVISVYNDLLRAKALPATYLADEFTQALTRADLPKPIVEYPFVQHAPAELQQLFLSPKTKKPRGWRADCAWPWHHVAAEIDGGVHIPGGGQHNQDREKRNAYAVIGWRVLYFDTDMILTDVGACVAMVRLALTPRDL